MSHTGPDASAGLVTGNDTTPKPPPSTLVTVAGSDAEHDAEDRLASAIREAPAADTANPLGVTRQLEGKA